MPTNVRPDIQRKLYLWPETLTPGLTSDTFTITIPLVVQYVAVANATNATLQLAVGRTTTIPNDAISVPPNNSLSAEIPDTAVLTVFWNSDQPIPQPTATNANRIIFWFSNEPIQLQVGSLSTSEAAQVTVTNTITSIMEGSNGSSYHAIQTDASGHLIVSLLNNHVNVDSLPSLPAGANNIGHVNVDAVAGIPQAAAAGIVATSQVTVLTNATALFNGVVSGKRIRISNTDAANVLYLGTSSVTTATGYPVLPNGEFIQDISPGQTIRIYGVASAALTAATMVIN